MVTQSQIRASNDLIPSNLPKDVTAVFIGATSGIGEYTLTQFAKHTAGLSPVVYFIGRVQEAGDRITRDCQALCPDGKFIFIKADTALLKNVDEVSQQLKTELEKLGRGLNLLFLSTGTLVFKTKTAEDLHLAVSLFHYSRTRFILNLLPLLRSAPSLRRVVSCFAATKEGPITTDDIQGWNTPITSIVASRGHGASLVTLTMEQLRKKAPEVSFIHDFPGPVKSGIARGTTGIVMGLMKAVFALVGPFMFIPNEDSGERHLYLCTSARYPAGATGKDGSDASGVPLSEGVDVAEGSDGKAGSGMYSVDEKCESGGQAVLDVLEKMRKDETVDKVWKDLEEQFSRITGNLGIE